MRIVLLEYPDEIKTFIRQKGKQFLLDKETLVISLSPKVGSFLKAEGISHQNTIAFFNNDSHVHIVENVEEIVQEVLRKFKFLDAAGLSKTYEHFFAYHSRFYLNYFMIHIEILNNIIQKNFISEIYVCDYNFRVRSQAIVDQGKERYLSKVVQLFCSQKSITCQKILARLPQKVWSWSVILESSVGLFANFYFTLYGLMIINHLDKKKKYLIVSTWGYKFEDIIKKVRIQAPDAKIMMVMADQMPYKRKIRLMLMSLSNHFSFSKKLRLVDYVLPVNFFIIPRRRDDLLSDSLKNINEKMFGELRSCFTHQGLNFYSLVYEKIEKGLKKEILNLNRSIQTLEKVFQKTSPRLILSPYSTGIYYAFGELSRLMHLPSCIITHGTHVPPHNKAEEIENYWLARGVVFNDYEIVALQTPWMKKFMDYYRDKRKTLETGPLVFSQANLSAQAVAGEKSRLGIRRDQKVIVYATTQRLLLRNRLYMTETPDEFISSLSDIANAVNRSSNAYLLIRPHPICDLKEEDFSRLLPMSTRITVLQGGRFEHVLGLADLVISYSSTCIEESLANGIPVILYDKWKRYNHFGIPESDGNLQDLRRLPVTYITNLEGLSAYIKEFTSSPEKQPLDAETLRPYRYGWEYNRNFYEYVESCFNGK